MSASLTFSLADLKQYKFLRAIVFSGLLLCSIIANAQLPDFDLTIDVAHETCPGNGTLTFNVENTVPGAVFLFTVYHNPDLEIPLSSSPGLTVDGLSAGTYTVIALQTLGTETSTQQTEVTIENQITPLTYTLSSTSHNCSSGGEITVTTLTGIAAQYEIISGPVQRPLQDSNVFPDLPAGMYNIRVFNNCGQAVVTTYTLVVNPGQPVVSPPIFDDVYTGDCDSVTITNTLSYPEGTVISYPLDVTYTINIPGGDPLITTMHFETGAPSQLDFINEFPVIEGQEYTYDLLVTNSCGIQYGNSGMAVNPAPEITYNVSELPCGKYYLVLDVVHYMPPFTLNFTEAPDGFDPAAFNGGYPGPYIEGHQAFGGEGQPMPNGNYNVTVTDACGRTASTSFTIQDNIPDPNASGRNNGCFSLFGRITANIPQRVLAFAEITNAPPTYAQPLPTNVSNFINSAGTLTVTDLPIGFYTLRLIDECGAEYLDVVVEVPAFVERDFTADAFADCTVGSGSVRVISGNGKLTQLAVTAAPAAFGQPLPFDVTPNLTSAGIFYMDNLPAGSYTFHGTDICGIERTVSTVITGYHPMEGMPFAFQPHCSSFDVQMFDADTSSGTPGYWLQKENPNVPGQWMHPGTGVVYTEGTLPSTENAISLQNNNTTVNLLYFGRFRIIKAFESVGNGVSSKVCFEVLGDFNYYDGVTIENIYNVSCLQNTDDIFVEATGLAPLNYRIESKDGMPFFLDNGNNSIFSGLATGSYQFVVEDACGHIGRRTENINLLPELADAHDPGGMLLCIQPGDPAFAEFDLSLQNAGILEDQSPSVYTITYHASLEDAEAGINPLPLLYTNISNPQIIYARLVHNLINICHDVVSFGLQVSEYPELHMNEDVYVCTGGGPVTLTADAGFDTYLWSTGATTMSIEVETPGTYSVTVGNTYGSTLCETTTDINVAASEAATVLDVVTDDWTDNRNSITVMVSGSGLYEYSLDGITYQDDPSFKGLETGIYSLYIRDKNGCGITMQEFHLLNYPKFFTPNGDGINDTWRIQYSIYEPDMEIYIYDRYGKLITGFKPDSNGWDGTYNGRPLPSTDYWFVVNREDGRVHKGHFSMLR